VKIYVYGKIQDEHANVVMYNLGVLINAANEIWKRGHQPFCPAWVALLGMMSGRPIDYKDYFDLGAAFLPDCGALYEAQPSPDSVGSNKEEKIAREHSIPIYTNMDMLIEYANTEGYTPTFQVVKQQDDGVQALERADLHYNTWRWDNDVRSGKPMVFVAPNIKKLIGEGNAPPELLKEIGEKLAEWKTKGGER
jgi:hypothetical protein